MSPVYFGILKLKFCSARKKESATKVYRGSPLMHGHFVSQRGVAAETVMEAKEASDVAKPMLSSLRLRLFVNGRGMFGATSRVANIIGH